MCKSEYIALIPAYKPQRILVSLVKELEERSFTTVVVNDGSGEEYNEIFRECAGYAELITHDENMGKGRALKTGLEYILKKYGENSIVVTLDADGQHLVEDAKKITDIADANKNALVLGERKMNKTAPKRSRFGNTLTKYIYYMATGKKVTDTQTGLRAFHGSYIREMLDICGEKYEYEMNVLLYWAKKQYSFIEHEIETVYIGKNEDSHFNPITDSVKIYGEIIKFSLASLTGFLADYIIYAIMLVLTKNLVMSNVTARFVSAVINFRMNQKFVFKSSDSTVKEAVKYMILAAGILAVNTIMLKILAEQLGLNKMLAKIMVELLLFMVSWTVQKFFIFGRRQGK